MTDRWSPKKLRKLDGVISVAIPKAHAYGDVWLVFVIETATIHPDWPSELGGKPILYQKIPAIGAYFI